MPIWPGSAGLKLERIMCLEDGDEANVSQLNTDVHIGTHVDAPWHFIPEGSNDVLMLQQQVGMVFLGNHLNVNLRSEK